MDRPPPGAHRKRRAALPRRALVALLSLALLAPGGFALAQPAPVQGGTNAAAASPDDDIAAGAATRPARDDDGGSPAARHRRPATSQVAGLGRPARADQASPSAHVTSVRPRGAHAPVALDPGAEAEASRRDSRPVAGGPPRTAPAATKRQGNRDKDDEATRSSQGERVWPVKAGDSTFTQAYGCVPQIANFYRSDPGCPPHAPVVHTGIDLAAPLGTPFYAAASGWVTEAGLDRPEGLANTRLIIQHDGRNRGYATEYLHWVAAYVGEGDYVEAGQPIGEIGSVGYSTGPHLHFAVIRFADGSHLDPLDWLPKDRRAGAYAGLAPNAKAVRFKNRSANVPDYADPAPPPLPRQEPVPESPAEEPRSERNQDKSKRERKERMERREERDERRAGRAEARDDERAGADDAPGDEKDRGERRSRDRDRTSDRGTGDDRPPRSDEAPADADAPDVEAADPPPERERKRGKSGDTDLKTERAADDGGKRGRGDRERDRGESADDLSGRAPDRDDGARRDHDDTKREPKRERQPSGNDPAIRDEDQPVPETDREPPREPRERERSRAADEADRADAVTGDQPARAEANRESKRRPGESTDPNPPSPEAQTAEEAVAEAIRD